MLRKASKRTSASDSHEFKKSLVAARIKEALAGLDKRAVAAKLGVSRATIYDWTSGRFLPDIERLALLAAIAGVSVSWLVTGHGTMRQDEFHPGGYVVPVGTNIQPAPIAVQKEWLTRQIWSPAVEVNLMVVTEDAMSPTLRRGDLLLYRNFHDLELGDARHPVTADSGIYVLSVGVKDSDRRPGHSPDPLSRLIARRVIDWVDGHLTIICDNPAYQAETKTVQSSEAPAILGPALWRGGLLP